MVKEIEVPRIRIYENSGTIKSTKRKPADLHYENYISPSSFISNNPNENQSHFIFCLFEGVDGSYKLLLLVYLKKYNWELLS